MDDDDENQPGSIGTHGYSCTPSLVALQQMKNRLHMAYLGKRLMKWLVMATRRELRRISFELQLIYEGYMDDVREAYILLARCRYFYPNLNKMVLENHAVNARIAVKTSTKAVASCKFTIFEICDAGTDSIPYLGIDKGGQMIQDTKNAWTALVERSIAMVALRTSFYHLDMDCRNATKKMNVLSKIVIPKTHITIKYILMELEERAREDFFRLKKVVEIKKKRAKKKVPKVEDNKTEVCDVCGEHVVVLEPVQEEEEKPIEKTNICAPIPVCPTCSNDMTKTPCSYCENLKSYNKEMAQDDDSYSDVSCTCEVDSTEGVCEKCEKMEKHNCKRTSPEPCGVCSHDKSYPRICDSCVDPSEEETAGTCKTLKSKEKGTDKQNANDGLGYFEKNVKKITKIIRTQNSDGTIKEEKVTITIRKERYDPDETCIDCELDDSDVNDSSHSDYHEYQVNYCTSSNVTMTQNLKLTMLRLCRSETVMKAADDNKLRECVSMIANFKTAGSTEELYSDSLDTSFSNCFNISSGSTSK